MILDKVPFTKEEFEQVKNAKSNYDINMIQSNAEHRYIHSFGEKLGYPTDFWEKYPLNERMKYISKEDIEKLKEAILADVKEILQYLKKSDFEYVIKSGIFNGTANFKAAVAFILHMVIRSQISACSFYKLGNFETLKLAIEKVSEWYETPQNFLNVIRPDELYQELVVNKYMYYLQNKETNALGHTSNKSFDDINYLTNSIIHNDVEIKILRPEIFARAKWNVNTHKVWDMSLSKLIDILPRGEKATLEMIDRKRTIKITVKEFAKKCNISERFARDYLNAAGKALYEISVRCEIDQSEQTYQKGRKRKTTDQPKKYKLHRVVAAISEDQNGYSVINGVLELTFDIDFAKYLSQHSRALPRHDNIFRINSNNHRHSYYIANKLQEHYFMNIGKTNANRISVRCLKEELPDLPTYEEVMRADGDRHVEKRIIRPFERDMNALVDEYNILETWHYCTKNGKILTNEQLQNYDYSDWNEWLIEFHLKEYPQQTEMMRLAEHSEKKKRATKSKKTKN